MIFAAVGNATQGFPRLLGALERLIADGTLVDEIVAQTGNTDTSSFTRLQAVPFLAPSEFASLIRDAEVVVCHAGAGTLLHVSAASKIPVVMPRLARHAEHVDDHQLELVEILARDRKIVPAYEPADLAPAIAQARRKGTLVDDRDPPPLIGLVRRAIEDLTARWEK